VDAERAEAWGMIWRTVDDAALLPEAEWRAGHLATQPTEALAATRRCADCAEGVQAFLEKRPPVFRGDTRSERCRAEG
jgi:2-(1,2-epoxy-1,2-dihydrophenyl)acetyl-CoA isomerase